MRKRILDIYSRRGQRWTVQLKLADPAAPVMPVAATVTVGFRPGRGAADQVPVFPPLVPGVIQAHLSAFSCPEESVHPPAGFWSVMVSAYSWPFTIEKPSSRPALPALTKFSPQVAPRSVT